MKPVRSSTGRWSRGSSGNPRGRPRGTATADRLRQSIEMDLPDIIRAVIEAAKAGDITAARLVLERVCPALKPQEVPVSVKLEDDTLSEQGRALMAATISGQISPSQGVALLAQLSHLSRLVEHDEFERRLTVLETASSRRTAP